MRLGVASVSRVLVTWQHVFEWCVACNASVCVTLFTGQPDCVAAHVALLVTVTNVRHHDVF